MLPLPQQMWEAVEKRYIPRPSTESMFAHTPLGLRGKHILERAFSGSTEMGVQVGELKRPAGLLLFCDVTGEPLTFTGQLTVSSRPPSPLTHRRALQPPGQET